MSAFSQGGLIQTTANITSGTLTLTADSSPLIIKTGASSATVALPQATSDLRISRSFTISNQGTYPVTVNYNDGTLATSAAPGETKTLTLLDRATSNGTWSTQNNVYAELPLDVRQTKPSPTANVVITSSKQYGRDGSLNLFSVYTSAATEYVETTINMQTGSVSGGTVTNEDAAFSLPATTTSWYRRMAVVYIASTNTVNVKFSSQFAVKASLPDLSTLFSGLYGTPIAALDLQALASGGFKSADSTDNVIKNLVGSSQTIIKFRSLEDILLASTRMYIDTTLPILKLSPLTTLNSTLSAIDEELNQPLRLFASSTPDSLLNIKPANLTNSDGGGEVASAFNDAVGNFSATTINFATGSVSGGTVTKDGSAFSLPTTTIGQYRRVAFVYKPDVETVDCTFSDPVVSYASLTNAGVLFSLLDGLPIGYIDIQAYAANSFKSANSGTNVISNSALGNPTIFRFGSGSGAGGAGDKSFNIANISTPTATLKGGSLILPDGRKLATYSGAGSSSTSFFKDISVNLTTVLGASPADATAYWLYIDLNTLGSATTLSDTGDSIFGVTQSNLKILTTSPVTTDLSRYISLGVIKTAASGNAWSGTGSSKNSQSKFRPNNQPTTVNPTVYRLNATVGSVGSTTQYAAGHYLTTGSFPTSLSAAAFSFYSLKINSNDGSGNSRNLTPNVSFPSAGTDILGASNVFSPTGTQSLASNSPFFDVGNDFTCGGWFYHSTWTTPAGVPRVLFSKYDTLDATGGLQVVLEKSGPVNYISYKFGAALASVFSTPTTNIASGWHHVAVMLNSATGQIRAYLDGTLVGTAAASGYANPAAPFMVATSRVAGVFSNFFIGAIEEVFFINSTIDDNALRKLNAYKLTHSRNVLTRNQEWVGTFTSTVAIQDNVSWLVDKSDPNTVYIDLSDYSSTSTVDISLRDNGYSGIVVSPTIYDTGYFSSAPTSPKNHNLPDIPNTIIFLYEVSPGEFESKQVQGIISANSTTITWDLSAYTFSATSRGRIIAAVGQSTASVPQATSVRSGLVKLTYTGFNKIIGTNELYSSLTNANLQSGDSVLILDGYSATSETISVSDVSITFMPGAIVSSTSSSPALTLSGSRINVYNANYNFFASSPASAVLISGNDNFISNFKLNGVAGTISAGFNVQAGALRNFITASVRSSGATVTTTVSDSGTDTDYSIRG
jgi:hypothetical protein